MPYTPVSKKWTRAQHRLHYLSASGRNSAIRTAPRLMAPMAGRNPRFRASTVRPRDLAGNSVCGHVDNRHTASAQSGGASAVP